MKYTQNNPKFVKVIDFLNGIYTQSFYSGKKRKAPTLAKMERKIAGLDNSLVIDRELLMEICLELNASDEKSSDRYKVMKKRTDDAILQIVTEDWHAFRIKFSKEMAFEVEKYFEHYRANPVLALNGLIYYYQNVYLSEIIRRGIKKLINPNPIDDYPDAREMKRHFVLHIGPTNSGKTYQALERLKECEKGIYLGPLRLLALEVYDKFNRAEVPCNLVTGEESSLVDGAVCQASTIEMLNTNDYYDIAVIDEAQMIGDARRGHSWTKAILGIRANEIHVCMANCGEEIVKKLIERCGDTYEIHSYERMTPLFFEEFPEETDETNFIKYLKPGDAVIAFSKGAVLGISEQIEKAGLKTSIIYGNLPPSARKFQVEQFATGKTQVVVSTDAIGMGINLPIKRIVFSIIQKFDGAERRVLRPQEIKQIAGRAGRKGIYEKGYVSSVENPEYVREALAMEDEKIEISPLGFPEILLDLPYDLNYLLPVWADIQPYYPFSKMDISDIMELYVIFQSIDPKLRENISKKEVYSLITCPLDTKEPAIVKDFKKCCMDYNNGCEEYNLPVFEENTYSLMDLEIYYKRLDLYYQMSRRTGKIIRENTLSRRRNAAINDINRILLRRYYFMAERKKRSRKYLERIRKKQHNS